MQDEESGNELSSRWSAVRTGRFRTDRPSGHPGGRARHGRTRRVDTATQALITELTRMVLRLKRNVDDLMRVAPPVPPSETDGADWALGQRPSVPSDHGVHFARSHDHAVAAAVEVIDGALEQGRSVVVIATGLHRRWIESSLQQRGSGFGSAALQVLDAEVTLSSFLVDGRPDRERFRSTIGPLLSAAALHSPHGVSVYGEMVGILWSDGNAEAALRLEELWNELQYGVPFSLVCGYLVDVDPSGRELDAIRHAHTYVA